MTLDTLKSEIGKLSRQERCALMQWLENEEEQAWDEQIRADHKAGKLGTLIDRAENEFDDGSIREAP
jgi:hypothetical protein